MRIPKSLPIETRERREVARLGRRITELAELDRPLDEDQVMELIDAVDQVAWLAGERRDWTGGEA